MAIKENKKISAETAAAALDGTEQLLGVQSGDNVRVSVDQIAAFIGAAPSPGGGVTSVNGDTGPAVTITKATVGLPLVNNTADTAKPVSTAQAAAIAAVASGASSALSAHAGNTSNPHATTATQVGLPLVENKSSATIRSEITSVNVTGALTFTPENAVNKGAANGYVPLDGAAKIASAYLPSFVDDVVEAANFAALPGTGEASKIYVTLDTNKTYRWSGSAYVEISASPGSTDAVTEGATNLYFTAARVLAVVLTGLSTATNAVITAADTVLYALGKLQKQISDNLATLTGHTSATNPHPGSQATLVSATNIKTINSTSLLGAGNIVISGGAPGGVDTQMQFNNAGVVAGSAAIRAVLVAGAGGFADATNARLIVGTAGSGVLLHANFGELYFINEAATAYANINISQLYASYRILCDNVTAGNNSYCAASSTTYTYGGFRVGSGSGVWWASTVGGANTDAVIDTGILRDSVGVLSVVLPAGGYGDFKAKNIVVDNVVKLKNFTVATLPSAATSGAGAQAYVTDALTPAYNTTVAGGGAVKICVLSDGTNWKS